MSTRTVEVDILRAMALVGICVVNVPFLAGLDAMSKPDAPIDKVATVIVEVFFQGKFFTLFSFLFGWSFFAQYTSAQRRRRPLVAKYLRRLSGLLLLGVGHVLLVFDGDILILYALLGSALLLVRQWTPVRLLKLAAGLTLMSLFSLAILGIALSELPMEYSASSGYSGSFSDAVHQRFIDWPYAFTVVALFNGPSAMAAFCTGLAAAKTGFFEPEATSYAAIRSRLPLLLVMGLLLNTAYMCSVQNIISGEVSGLLAFSALALGAPCLSIVYLVVIVELVRSGRLGERTAAAGRLSLTAYLAQGVIAGLIFNGYGLGLYREAGMAMCVVIALGIVVLVHIAAILWLSVCRQGPMEYILRKMTHGVVPITASSDKVKNRRYER
ncbi:MAG: DUF418 domain-containing protein [Granulosicoccus sp.]